MQTCINILGILNADMCPLTTNWRRYETKSNSTRGRESRLNTVLTVTSLLGGEVGVCEFCTHKSPARVQCQEMSHWRQGIWLAGVYWLCAHARPIEHTATMPTGSLPKQSQYNKPLPLLALINRHVPILCNASNKHNTSYVTSHTKHRCLRRLDYSKHTKGHHWLQMWPC